MEIIHVVLGKANPERMNGVNKVVYQLATRQASQGKKVSLWGITHTLQHNYGTRNFETRLYQAYRNPFQLDKQLVADLTAMKGKAVIHLHGGWIPVFASLSWVLARLEIPFVLTPHGAYNLIAMQRSNWIKKIYFQLFEKKLLKRAGKIHCIGESEVEGLKTIFMTDKTFLLPYGFEGTKAIQPIPQKQKRFVIGFVGRLDIHTKGLDLLLDAFSQLYKEYSDSSLWIVGDSGERVLLEKMVQSKGLEDKVVLWGSKFGKDKDELMQQMDVFVHPSRNEGLPSSVLEAASLGVPCLVSKATNVGSYVLRHQAGYVIDNENSEQLRKKLEVMYLIKELGSLTEMGASAKKMVEHSFSWDSIVREFDQLYSVA